MKSSSPTLIKHVNCQDCANIAATYIHTDILTYKHTNIHTYIHTYMQKSMLDLNRFHPKMCLLERHRICTFRQQSYTHLLMHHQLSRASNPHLETYPREETLRPWSANLDSHWTYISRLTKDSRSSICKMCFDHDLIFVTIQMTCSAPVFAFRIWYMVPLKISLAH